MKMHEDFDQWFQEQCSGKSKYEQLRILTNKCSDDYLGYSPAGTLNNWFANKSNYVKCVRYIMNDDAPDYVADLGQAIVELDGQTKSRIIQSILWEDETATKYKLCRV